jgi:hypothetical protein
MADIDHTVEDSMHTVYQGAGRTAIVNRANKNKVTFVDVDKTEYTSADDEYTTFEEANTAARAWILDYEPI